MKNFGNNKTVNFEEIEESGIYSKELLKQYLLARIPFIGINTIEKGRALEYTKKYYKDNDAMIMWHYL